MFVFNNPFAKDERQSPPGWTGRDSFLNSGVAEK
jgi:hypothetical protein